MEGWMRLLERLRKQTHVVDLAKRAAIAERIVGPDATQNLEPFVDPRPTLFVGNVVAGVLGPGRGPPDPDVEAAAAQHVENGKLFCDLNGVVERQQGDAHADPEAVGLSGDRRGQHLRRWRDAEGGEMVLGDPDRVEGEGFGRNHLSELGYVDV